MKTPAQYSLVKVDLSCIPNSYHHDYPFKHGDIMIFLGEIPNMRGHCIIMHHPNGPIYSGYHLEYFIEVDDG
jgi:hypothetical protein